MINLKNITSWIDNLSGVIDKNFSTDAIAQLLKFIEHVVEGSSAMITLYSKSGAPETTHHRLLANEDPRHHIDTYESGAYLLDPFYRHAIDHDTEGVFTLNDVAPQGFEESEYYALFYQKSHFKNEMCIIFKFEDGMFLSISLVQHQENQTFSPKSKDMLNDFLPLLKSIFRQWLMHYKQTNEFSFEGHLEHALNAFGHSLLTPKEREIVYYVLHGYAIKTIAEKLNNSVETIKHHRKSIYTKLDVTTQSELFYLFIASLKALPKGAKEDPLIFVEG